MPAVGEKPGAGVYECPFDGQRVILESDAEVLMECPSCEGFLYLSVSHEEESAETPARPS
ncbi:MAG: hypothetical protein M5U22_21615 [Thermoleophilia bacterium]|nr:hypothetical protein [Thermoleophilia bacterium]